MSQAKHNDIVKVHYTGKLNDGTVFDSSVEREPLQFTLGEGQVIPGFEQAVLGMTPGDSRTVTIASDQAYGPYRPDLVLSVDRDQFPPDITPETGQRLQVRQTNGDVALVTVTDVGEAVVKLDANHPLAGQDLTFDIELVEID